MKLNTSFIACLAALSLTGCSLSPSLNVPVIETPKHEESALHVKAKWWEKFGDERLNKLIDVALIHNDDIKLSAMRILKAQQAYGLANANLYPTLSSSAGLSNQKTSAQTYTQKSYEYTDHSVALNLSYEIDFWGKLSQQKASNLDLFLASKTAAQTVKNTLIHDVILAYFNLASLDERLDILERTSLTYKENYEFRLKQQKFGTINELLVHQALAQYNSIQAAKNTLNENRKVQYSALSILLGESPKALFESGLPTVATLPQALQIPKGIPSSLLESRPDIQEALFILKSKNALIGVEKAAYFPNISLSGSYGQQSENSNNLFSSSANRWSYGPSLQLPIFDFGRIQTRVALSETDLRTSLITYEQTVKKAYKEVYDALAKNMSIEEKIRFNEEEILAYKKIFELSQIRFTQGVANHLEVLEAQKGLLNASTTKVLSQQAYLVAQAELFKALGSGWNEKMLLEER